MRQIISDTQDKNNINWMIAYGVLYWSIILIVHITLVSIVTFFHFQLNHEFESIEDWILKHAWELLSISKISGFFVTWRFLSAKLGKNDSLFKYLRRSWTGPSQEILVGILFLLTCTLLWRRPMPHEETRAFFSFSNNILSFIGTFFFFLPEIFFLDMLGKYFPSKNSLLRLLFDLSFLGIIYIFYQEVFIYTENIRPFHYLQFLILFILNKLGHKRGLTYCTLYTVLFLGPLVSILGQDPLWGNKFSLFEFKKDLSVLFMVNLWALFFIYIFYKNRQNYYTEALDIKI